MKLENINLLQIEDSSGFIDILDLEEVECVLSINDAIKIGQVQMKNGLIRNLDPGSARKVRECLRKK